MTGASIGVVIPNWNGGEHFRRCLESLSCQSDPRFEVVVVDNDSYDRSWETWHGSFRNRSSYVSIESL